MLLQNVTIWAQYPGQRRGGSTATGTDGNGSRTVLGIKNNRQLTPFYGAFTNTNSFPVGWQFGNGWMPPMKDGGAWKANLGPTSGLDGETTFEGAGALGRNLAAALTGSGDITSAIVSLIVYAIAALTGSVTVSADASANGELTAALSGDGDLTATATAIEILLAAASLSGSGDVTAAAGALAGLAAAIEGAGGAGGSTASATGALEAAITVTGDLLTTGNVAASVWQRAIEAGFTAEQILRILAAHAAGAATGLEGSDPQFTGLDGSTVRIDGTYSAGTRTIDSLNGD